LRIRDKGGIDEKMQEEGKREKEAQSWLAYVEHYGFPIVVLSCGVWILG